MPLYVLIPAAIASACSSSSPEVPRGDDLDELLHAVPLTKSVELELRRCAQSAGVALTDRDVDTWFRPTANAITVDPKLQGSGLVSSMLGDTPQEQLGPDDRLAALSEPLDLEGVAYAGGCREYIDNVVADSEAERLRRILYDRYGEDVSSRVRADDRWVELDRQWATCMTESGFDGYRSVGDHLDDILRRIDAAKSRAELEQLVDFDAAVTTAAQECFVDIGAGRAEVIAEHEAQFIKENRGQLESLVLLVSED